MQAAGRVAAPAVQGTEQTAQQLALLGQELAQQCVWMPVGLAAAGRGWGGPPDGDCLADGSQPPAGPRPAGLQQTTELASELPEAEKVAALCSCSLLEHACLKAALHPWACPLCCALKHRAQCADSRGSCTVLTSSGLLDGMHIWGCPVAVTCSSVLSPVLSWRVAKQLRGGLPKHREPPHVCRDRNWHWSRQRSHCHWGRSSLALGRCCCTSQLSLLHNEGDT